MDEGGRRRRRRRDGPFVTRRPRHKKVTRTMLAIKREKRAFVSLEQRQQGGNKNVVLFCDKIKCVSPP